MNVDGSLIVKNENQLIQKDLGKPPVQIENLSFRTLAKLIAEKYCVGEDHQIQKASLAIIYLDGRPLWFKSLGLINSKEALYASIWKNEENNSQYRYYLSCLKLTRLDNNEIDISYSRDPINLDDRDYSDILENGVDSEIFKKYK